MMLSKLLIISCAVCFIVFSCSVRHQVDQISYLDEFIETSEVADAHFGIYIFDLISRKPIITYNSHKLFIPASNIKFLTLYAGLKYLPDSIPGISYAVINDTLYIKPTGDPSFLSINFSEHPVFDFFKGTTKPVVFIEPEIVPAPFGYGWPWNFYLNSYMSERSPFPIYDNCIIWSTDLNYTPHKWPVIISSETDTLFKVYRPLVYNEYYINTPADKRQNKLTVPFVTNGISSSISLLSDTLKREVSLTYESKFDNDLFSQLYSQPADSLYRNMMVFSNNFYAEQILLMAADKQFGQFNESLIISTMLNSDFQNMENNIRWYDASGLSRYNLMSPISLVYIMEKICTEFGIERLKSILPTGDEGTLQGLYVGEKGMIFAKTGTLSNTVTLSGIIYTKQGKELLFSVMVNNHNRESIEVRLAIEGLLSKIINFY